jgi:hypothetical protein
MYNYIDKKIPYEPEWWHAILIVLTGVAVIIGIIYGINEAFFKPVTVKGVVLSHTVTANRHGEASYHTIARFEDGYIRELEGLNDYIKPIGATVTHTNYVLK